MSARLESRAGILPASNCWTACGSQFIALISIAHWNKEIVFA